MKKLLAFGICVALLTLAGCSAKLPSDSSSTPVSSAAPSQDTRQKLDAYLEDAEVVPPTDIRPISGVPEEAVLLYSTRYTHSTALGYSTIIDIESTGTMYIYLDIDGSIDLYYRDGIFTYLSMEKATSNLYEFTVNQGTTTLSTDYKDITGALYVYFLPLESPASSNT